MGESRSIKPIISEGQIHLINQKNSDRSDISDISDFSGISDVSGVYLAYSRYGSTAPRRRAKVAMTITTTNIFLPFLEIILP
jgi:hypothetical protein